MKPSWRKITVEPLVFLICISKGFLSAVEGPGYYFKSCHAVIRHDRDLGLNASACDIISNRKSGPNTSSNLDSLKTLVSLTQKQTSDYFLAITVASSISVGIGNLFWGVHADNYGRKTAIISGQMGVTMQLLLWIITLHWLTLPMYLNPLVVFVIGFTGLLMGTLSASSQYLGDLYAKKNDMMMKITIMNFSLFIGMISGTLAAGAILKLLPFAETLSIAIVPAILSLFCTFCTIRPGKLTSNKADSNLSDSCPVPNAEENTEIIPDGNWNMFTEIKLGGLDLWKTLIKQRPHGKRKIFWLSLLAYFFARAADQGAEGVLSLYSFGAPFNLSPSEHALFTGLNNGIQALGALCGACFFKKLLEWSDEACMLIGLASLTCRFVVVATASSKLWLFMSSVAGVLSDLFLSSFQAFLYTLIHDDEYGKVTALEITSIHVAMIVCGVVFNKVYSLTLDTFAQTVFIVVAALPLMPMGFSGYVWLGKARADPNERLLHAAAD